MYLDRINKNSSRIINATHERKSQLVSFKNSRTQCCSLHPSLRNISHVKMENHSVPLQRYFDTQGYQDAKAVWEQALDNAECLDTLLDQKVAGGCKYSPSLKINLEGKAKKAGTTLLGEALETMHWGEVGNNAIVAAGGSAGSDLQMFENISGFRANAFRYPKNYGEVKSATNVNTYRDGVVDAHERKGGTGLIFMHIPNYFDASDLYSRFMRRGIYYMINPSMDSFIEDDENNIYKFCSVIEQSDGTSLSLYRLYRLKKVTTNNE